MSENIDALVAFLNTRMDVDERPVVTERMRREIKAKRAILAEREEVRAKFEEFSASTDRELSGWWAGRVIEIERTLRTLGAIYSDHPDYRPSFSPDGALNA